jgi:cyclic beta-1,2-glucan synthetase
VRQEGSITPRALAGGGLELLGIELLEEHARRLAALLSVARRGRGRGRAHLRRLNDDARVLRRVYTALADDARRDGVSPAAEWLLDNFHVISTAARDIRHDLPPSFFRRLPRVATDEFAGLPRIHALALELIRCSAGSLDAQRLHRFITAFQSITPLTIGELWAWPSALKFALVQHLRVRADILAQSRVHQREADRLAGTLETGSVPLGRMPADLHPAFVTRLLQRSREYGATAAALRRELDAALAARGRTIEDAIRSEGRYQAAEQATMASLVGSLRLISSFDWSEFFESVSLVEQVLQRDPAGTYSRMDFRSRDRYRHAVEELAEPTGDDQLRVALKCVERARQIGAQTPDARGTHVGYHLVGKGRRAFEQSANWAPSPGERVRRAFFHYATPVYLGALTLGTATLLGVTIYYAHVHGWRGTALVLLALLAVVPLSELTIQMVQRIISRLIPRSGSSAWNTNGCPPLRARW